MCVSASQKSSFFRPTVVVTGPRAGGVSPPWSRSRLCSGKRNHSTKITRRCRCVFRYHGGLTPAALVNARSCIAKIVFSPTNVRIATRAGGVSPPWETKRRCKSQPLFCNDLRACNQERLAQASRGFGNTLAAASSHLSRRGDPPAVCTRTPLQLHYHTHGGLTPVSGRKRPQLQLRYSHPRRADPCRSCECALAHRKNRFFRRQTFALHQERGA
jgi:hypothetical protein